MQGDSPSLQSDNKSIMLHRDLYTTYCYFSQDALPTIQRIIKLAGTRETPDSADQIPLITYHCEILNTESIFFDRVVWIVVKLSFRIDHRDPCNQAEQLLTRIDNFWKTHRLVCQRIMIACHLSLQHEWISHPIQLSYQWLFAPMQKLSSHQLLCLLDFARNHCLEIRQMYNPTNPSFGEPYTIDWKPLTTPSTAELHTIMNSIQTFLDKSFNASKSLYNYQYQLQVKDRRIMTMNKPLSNRILDNLFHPVLQNDNLPSKLNKQQNLMTSQATTNLSIDSESDSPVSMERRSTTDSNSSFETNHGYMPICNRVSCDASTRKVSESMMNQLSSVATQYRRNNLPIVDSKSSMDLLHSFNLKTQNKPKSDIDDGWWLGVPSVSRNTSSNGFSSTQP